MCSQATSGCEIWQLDSISAIWPTLMQLVWFMSTTLYLSTELISLLGAVGNGAVIRCVVDAIN